MFVKGYSTDTGYDIPLEKEEIVPANGTAIIELPVKYNPPEGTLAYLSARTSSARTGLLVASPPIDHGYEGPLYAIVTNLKNYDITIKKGERICQLIVYPFRNGPECKILHPDKSRGEGAFGSSGK